ncbi:MAG: hypothetical protein Kapaf2KO_07470 [Candidatus Kapaibacteriales bacterium]
MTFILICSGQTSNGQDIIGGGVGYIHFDPDFKRTEFYNQTESCCDTSRPVSQNNWSIGSDAFYRLIYNGFYVPISLRFDLANFQDKISVNRVVFEGNNSELRQIEHISKLFSTSVALSSGLGTDFISNETLLVSGEGRIGFRTAYNQWEYSEVLDSGVFSNGQKEFNLYKENSFGFAPEISASIISILWLGEPIENENRYGLLLEAGGSYFPLHYTDYLNIDYSFYLSIGFAIYRPTQFGNPLYPR